MGDRPIVDAACGKLRGLPKRSEILDPYDYYAFLGIPYAEPPTGELRFKDPIPAKKWPDVRDVNNYGSVCAQLDSFGDGTLKGSDDCLYLNVFTKNLQNVRRPTMVWIHGGAFIEGSGSDDEYGPDFLMTRDIVLVTVNYRVGILGFLNLDDEVAPGNQGLKDMVMALKWVKNNIENFGGDPDNVTIFGESAGGAAVHYLSISPQSKGLFHKAISQSGTANAPWAFLDDPKIFALKLSKYLGCNSQNPREIAEFLRKVDCLKLAEAQNVIRSDEEKVAGIFSFSPSVDSKSKNPFLPKSPMELFKDGVHVPFILGYTSKEGFLSIPNSHDPRPRELMILGCKFSDFEKIDKNFENYIHPKSLETLRKKYGLSARDLKELYFGNQTISGKTLDQYSDLNGDLYFIESIHDVAEYQVRHQCPSTFLYVMTYDKGFSLAKTKLDIGLPGVCHGDDLGYLFSRKDGKVPVVKGIQEQRIMEQMVELWTNFAKTGNPTPMTSNLIPCKWQPLADTEQFDYLNIGDELEMKSVDHIKKKYGGGSCKM